MEKSKYSTFLVLMFILGIATEVVIYSSEGMLLSLNVDMGFYLPRAYGLAFGIDLAAFGLALTLVRYWDLRTLGRSIALGYFAYLLVFAAILLPQHIGLSDAKFADGMVPTLVNTLIPYWGFYLFFFMGKLFVLLVVVYVWGLANQSHSFQQASKMYLFYWIAYSLGLTLVMGISKQEGIALQGWNAFAFMEGVVALLAMTIWWATARIPEAAEGISTPSQGSWLRFIIPLSLALGSLDALSHFFGRIWTTHLKQVFSNPDAYHHFTSQLSLAVGGLDILCLLVAAVFGCYLWARGLWAWTVCSFVLVYVAVLLQALWLGTHDPSLVLGGTASIFMKNFAVPLFGVLALIVFTALPLSIRWDALVWIQLLLHPTIESSFGKLTTLSLTLGLPALAIYVLLAIVAVASVVVVAHFFGSISCWYGRRGVS